MASAGAGAGAESTTTTTTTSDKTPSSSSSSKNKLYKGVRLRKWGKWVSEIRLPNSRERIWLGSYDSPEKAARAFDAALYCLRGRHASFNFPDTPFNVPAPHHSLTPQEIQEIAANFANKFDPPPPPQPLVVNTNNQEQPSSRFGSNTATSSSTTRYELCDQGTTQVQVDNNNGDDSNSGMNNIDWTFLNVLGESSSDNYVGSDNNDNNYYYGLYSELEKMHSDEFLYSTPPPPLFEYNNEDEIEAADPFSHQSFLWNWNF